MHFEHIEHMHSEKHYNATMDKSTTEQDKADQDTSSMTITSKYLHNWNKCNAVFSFAPQ